MANVQRIVSYRIYAYNYTISYNIQQNYFDYFEKVVDLVRRDRICPVAFARWLQTFLRRYFSQISHPFPLLFQDRNNQIRNEKECSRSLLTQLSVDYATA